MENTTPYSPEQNGKAERMNRTLIEMTRCMLKDSRLDKQFWGEAIMTAIHILNCIPRKEIKTSAYEIWHKRKPDLGSFLKFGVRVHVFIPEEKRRKLDDKSKKGIFLGYEPNTKGYRIFNENTGKIIVSRNVILSEQETLNNEKENTNIENQDKKLESTNTEVALGDQDNDSQALENDRPILRRSEHTTKGRAPQRLIDVMKVVDEDIDDPTTVEEALASVNGKEWKDAMVRELKALEKNGTWEIVDNCRTQKTVIGNKWVFKTKRDEHGQISKRKARLVAKGYAQKYGDDYNEVFAPAVKQASIRLLFALAHEHQMKIKHYDVETAFLNGDLSHDVYMEQPEHFERIPGKVLKLKKGLYGLRQGAFEWNRKLDDNLKNIGFTESTGDQCLYSKHIHGEHIYVCVHVDDFAVAASTDSLFTEFESQINSFAHLNDLGEIKCFLGVQVVRGTGGEYVLHQQQYINSKIRKYGLADAKVSKVPLDIGYRKIVSGESFDNQKIYRSAIGALLFLANHTRPDICAAVSILTQKVSNPTVLDWNEVKRVYRYLKGTLNYGLIIGGREKNMNSSLCAYSDADWGNNPIDRKSNTGYCIFYKGSIIAWSCRKQEVVATSSTAAEYIALAETIQEVLWIKKLLNDFGVSECTPTIFEDNQSCIRLCQDHTSVKRTKHLEVKFNFICDLVKKKVLILEFECSENMIADMFTKPLQRQKLEKFSLDIGLQTIKS